MTWIALAILLSAGSLSAGETMKKEERLKAVARLVEEMYNRDLSVADDIFHPGCIHHVNGTTDELKGPEAIRKSIREMRQTFSRFHTTIDELLAEGDLVAFRWTWVGTMKGPGTESTLHGNTVFRFTDGKVIEEWAIDDRLREMQRLGFTLTPPQPR